MIEGLKVIDLDVHTDERGWFKENWNNQSFPFHAVQNNVSMNLEAGTTRGLHAEPWDKLVSVASGRVFGGWCDLREGSPTFGETFSCEIDASTAVYVPRGVANGFQALEDDTTYIYLVNDHWSADADYSFVTYQMIDWPLEPKHLSAADQKHPALSDAVPVPPRRVLVTGANGQLGRALREVLPTAEFVDHSEFDVANPPSRNWRQYSAIINAAAYNDVNGAETNRAAAWATNAIGPAKLARICAENDLTFVHVSSDYIFDGTVSPHTEDEVPSPISAYGFSKAAGDTAAQTVLKHYVIRTAWVFGDGTNFMSTMRDLAKRGIEPSVVHDQWGRPTYAEDLAKAIVHLLSADADYGVYNVTSEGDAVSRDEIAMAVFIGLGHDPSEVTPVSTAEYAALTGRAEAPRPPESTLDLSKIEATGFTPSNWRASLALYLALNP